MDAADYTQAKSTGHEGASIPQAAKWLGFSGLIPFIALSLFGWLGPETWRESVNLYLLGYGMVILSFMGGVHWGLAMAWNERGSTAAAKSVFTVSVVPALAAWLALLMPNSLQLLWLAVCFGALLAYDVTYAQHSGAPKWYPKLRWPLTLVVVSCLLLAAVTRFAL